MTLDRNGEPVFAFAEVLRTKTSTKAMKDPPDNDPQLAFPTRADRDRPTTLLRASGTKEAGKDRPHPDAFNRPKTGADKDRERYGSGRISLMSAT